MQIGKGTKAKLKVDTFGKNGTHVMQDSFPCCRLYHYRNLSHVFCVTIEIYYMYSLHKVTENFAKYFSGRPTNLRHKRVNLHN